jgi:hypothetical protein
MSVSLVCLWVLILGVNDRCSCSTILVIPADPLFRIARPASPLMVIVWLGQHPLHLPYILSSTPNFHWLAWWWVLKQGLSVEEVANRPLRTDRALKQRKIVMTNII